MQRNNAVLLALSTALVQVTNDKLPLLLGQVLVHLPLLELAFVLAPAVWRQE